MKHLQTLQKNVEVIYQKRLDRLEFGREEILLSKVVLLDTELSEFMNEIEDHKLYKLNKKSNKTSQLEELCDCIHVICSIANMLDIQLREFDVYSNAVKEAKDIMTTYKKVKTRVNSINIGRAFDCKEYITFALEQILGDVLSIAIAKDFTQAEILTAFVAVYTKNMIRAKGNY